MSKEIVLNTAHHFNWVNLGGAVNHPDKGKGFNLSDECNKLTGLSDSDIKVFDGDGHVLEDDKELIQFATYDKQDFYDYHRDCDIVQPKYRKLSVTVQLSDPETYWGGDLFIRHFWGEKNLPINEELRNRGTVIVFPSLLLHSVTRVIKGTRHSLVQWYSGPDFV